MKEITQNWRGRNEGKDPWKNERNNSKTGRDETKKKALGRMKEITQKLEGTQRRERPLEE
jgi:hypothetical protein